MDINYYLMEVYCCQVKKQLRRNSTSLHSSSPAVIPDQKAATLELFHPPVTLQNGDVGYKKSEDVEGEVPLERVTSAGAGISLPQVCSGS